MRTNRLLTLAVAATTTIGCATTTTGGTATEPSVDVPAIESEDDGDPDSLTYGTYSGQDLEDCVLDTRREGDTSVIIGQQPDPTNNMLVITLTLEPDLGGDELKLRIGPDDVDDEDDKWVDVKAKDSVKRVRLYYKKWNEADVELAIFLDDATRIFPEAPATTHKVNTIGSYDKRRKESAEIAITTREVKTAIGVYDTLATVWVEFNGRSTAFTLRTY